MLRPAMEHPCISRVKPLNYKRRKKDSACEHIYGKRRNKFRRHGRRAIVKKD
jgi:hypothetical protein